MGGDTKGVGLKLGRADKHIIDLELAMDGFRFGKEKPYSIGVKPHPVSEIQRVILFVETLKEVPDPIPLLIGDAVHNLRSALDHLAWQLVLANGEKPTRETEFPIGDPAKTYSAAFSDGKVKGMCVGAQKLIRDMQPCHSKDLTLWHLNTLDIADKHRLLITAQLESESWGVKDRSDGVSLWFDQKTFAIVQGQEIVSLPLAVYQREKHDYFQLALDIAFGQSEIVAGESVLGTLHHLAKFTASTVVKFERFFR